MRKNYCVIGSPVGHSLSPVIHNALYGIYGLDCVYGKQEVTPTTLAAFLRSLGQKNIRGFNVTMPLKREIIPFLAYLSPEAAAGANTVVVQEDGLYGYSTDAQGFYASLRQVGADYRGADIVLIGAGAVARLLCADAARKGARRITLINRTPEKAKKIALEYGAGFDLLSNINDHMDRCTLLVNTTPLGMTGAAGHFADYDFIARLSQEAVVCDLIYSPPRTELLAHAAARGLKTMNGLGMLVWQAFYAFEKWFGILPTREDYQTVLKRL